MQIGNHISIHALTRSATSAESPSQGIHIFQSTHSQGVRPTMIGAVAAVTALFQSTHSQGVRPQYLVLG